MRCCILIEVQRAFGRSSSFGRVNNGSSNDQRIQQRQADDCARERCSQQRAGGGRRGQRQAGRQCSSSSSRGSTGSTGPDSSRSERASSHRESFKRAVQEGAAKAMPEETGVLFSGEQRSGAADQTSEMASETRARPALA